MVEELDLFSFSTPEYHIKKPIRLIEMFAGIGCQAKAEKINSNSALYKQAGNGIVVNTFAAIIKNLL